ncbi:MAG: hypothetical protein ACRDG9_05980, partial [Actinomycetota bacterium]
YVAVLRSSAGEQHILLTADLLVNLAASIMMRADKNPRELGAVSETELLPRCPQPPAPCRLRFATLPAVPITPSTSTLRLAAEAAEALHWWLPVATCRDVDRHTIQRHGGAGVSDSTGPE